MAAVIIGLVIHAFMYAPQPAIMAEMFPTRMRYSGVSLGYQVTSIVAGSLAPIIAVKLLDESTTPRCRSRCTWPAPRSITLVAVLFTRETKGIDLETARSRPTATTSPEARRRMSDLDGRTAWSPAVRAGSARRAPGSSPPAARRSRSPTSTKPARRSWPQEIGGQAWAVDLLDVAALENLQLETDILVNNAGVQSINSIVDFAPERFRTMLTLMVEAPFLLIRAALPHMYRQKFGRVINISSVHGIRASEYKVAYVTAKHALEGLSKVTALEGGPHDVTSNCVNPGYVRTPLVTKQIADQARTHGIPEDQVVAEILLKESAIKRLVEPEEVAALVGWLASPAAGMVTGASYTMDGGWSAR